VRRAFSELIANLRKGRLMVAKNERGHESFYLLTNGTIEKPKDGEFWYLILNEVGGVVLCREFSVLRTRIEGYNASKRGQKH